MNAVQNVFLTIEQFNVTSDVFSQAITGELIGMSNFASLADTIDDPYEKMEAVEHANSERGHAEGFLAYAKKAGLKININLQSEYWGNVRRYFLQYAEKKDFIACLIIQEVMLESFAVSMYTDVGNALGGEAGRLFLSIADEEKEHLEHSSDLLRAALKENPDAFINKFEEIHFKCMTVLAEFTATTDLRGHCGVCNGSCMKGSLHHIGLDVISMRGRAMALYADALDNIGIRRKINHMDSASAGLDFAAIGHQDNWQTITSFVNEIRAKDPVKLSTEQIKQIFPYLPPRDLFKVQVRSITGSEIKGVYIETFIDPGKLDAKTLQTNINKVKKAVAHATKMGAKIVAMGGFTSILLEGNLDDYTTGETKFTTGNTLTTAFIVKGIEQTAAQLNINLEQSTVLCIGATGDIGLACVDYLKHRVKKLLLCARNPQRLEALAMALQKEKVDVAYSTSLEDHVAKADIIICMASSAGIPLANCKKGVLICDAGYPKNLDSGMEDDFDLKLFHGGMGQVVQGYHFNPDYSNSIYRYSSPNIIHGCLLEAMVMAFENRYENYSAGKGKITTEKVEEIYRLSLKHGISIAPFYNAKGLWPSA